MRLFLRSLRFYYGSSTYSPVPTAGVVIEVHAEFVTGDLYSPLEVYQHFACIVYSAILDICRAKSIYD